MSRPRNWKVLPVFAATGGFLVVGGGGDRSRYSGAWAPSSVGGLWHLAARRQGNTTTSGRPVPELGDSSVFLGPAA
jgi:hypothetical protein